MAEVGIRVVSPSLTVAPVGLWFEATVGSGFALSNADPQTSYDPAFHELTFAWRVTGGALDQFSAPENMVDGWAHADQAWGREVVFTFPRPGRYTVEVRVVDQSNTEAIARTDVEIDDPDDVYPGGNTLCVSIDPGETWAGAPQGAAHVTEPEAVEKALRSADTPLRVLLRRGQRFDGLRLSPERRQLGVLGAWGDDGARPIVTPRGSGSTLQLNRRSNMTSLTLADLDFRGGWDPTTETGPSPNSPFTWAGSRVDASYMVWNCNIEGYGFVSPQVGETSSSVILANCRIANWRDYGVLMRSENARFAIVGSTIAQHPEALHGGDKSSVPSNNHGPVRIPDCERVYIGASDFFSRTGWSGVAGERADQPCLRLNTSGRRGARMVLDRVVAEGGLSVISITGANRDRERRPGNYLIDRALLIATAKTIGPFVSVGYGGTTLRNIIGILPDAPRRHPNRWPGGIAFNAEPSGAGNTRAPVAVYSSTFLSLARSQNKPKGDWLASEGYEAFDVHLLENNLTGDAAAFDLSEPLTGITPRFRGIRYNFEPVTGTMSASIPPGSNLVVPYVDLTTATVLTTDAPGTTQSYWKDTEPFARAHVIRVGRRAYRAETEEIKVTFTERGAEVTNLSGREWEQGDTWALRLDRVALIAPMDKRYENPSTLPAPHPSGPRPSRVQHGRVAWDDFFGRPRQRPAFPGAIDTK